MRCVNIHSHNCVDFLNDILAVVFGFLMLAVKIIFLLFGKMFFVYGGKLFEILKSL